MFPMTRTALTICAIAMILFYVAGAAILWAGGPAVGGLVMNAGIVIGLLGMPVSLDWW